jgi:TP901 family phage tail tape measure protein
MALERIGLGGTLTFDSTQAVNSMGRARDAFGRFVQGVDRIPASATRAGTALRTLATSVMTAATGVARGLGTMMGGLRSLGVAALPLAGGLALAVGQAASFESAMDRVNAVTLGTEEDMASLTREARRLGIATTFSASEAAAGMEEMARAGATTNQILTGVEGVMAAAAAEGLELARATEIVGITAHTAGLGWDQSAHISDVLALASARTASSIDMLGEAFSYGGLQAHAAGMSLERTAAIMGILHNAGLRGSTAGTALQNALLQLASPTDAAAARLEEWGIVMTTSADGGLDLANIITQIQGHMDGLGTDLERTAAANEIFGIRGGRAYFALAQAGEEATDTLEASLIASSDFVDGHGAAAEMAARQLDNLAGSWRLFTSSIEGANIAVFTPMLQPLATLVRHSTEGLNLILEGINALQDAGTDAADRFEAMQEIFDRGGSVALNIVMGVTDAIADMGNMFAWVEAQINAFGEAIGANLGGDIIRQMVRFGILIGVIGGLLAPVLLAFGAIAFIISAAIIPIVTGLWEIIVAVAGAISWPLLAIAGAVAFVFMIIRQDGESFMDTMIRIWSYIQAAALEVWEGGILPLYEGLMGVLGPAFSEIGAIWSETFDIIRDAISTLWETTDGATDGMSVDWYEVGAVIGEVVVFLATALSTAIQWIALGLQFWAQGIAMFVADAQAAWAAVSSFFTAYNEFVVGLWVIIGSIAGAVWDWIAQKAGEAWATIQGWWAPVGAWFSSLFGGVEEAGGGAFEWLTTAASEAYAWITEVFSPLTTFFADLWNEIAEMFSTVFGGVLEAIGAVVGEVRAVGRGAMGPEATAEPAGPSFAERVSERAARARAGGGSAAETEMEGLGRATAEERAARTRRAEASPDVAVEVTVDDSREIAIDNRVCMDGAEVARATERHREEVSERAGFRATPWERRVRVEHGATRLGG